LQQRAGGNSQLNGSTKPDFLILDRQFSGSRNYLISLERPSRSKQQHDIGAALLELRVATEKQPGEGIVSSAHLLGNGRRARDPRRLTKWICSAAGVRGELGADRAAPPHYPCHEVGFAADAAPDEITVTADILG
jgi:hypothetical protein